MSSKIWLVISVLAIFSCSTKSGSERDSAHQAQEFYASGDAIKGKDLFATCTACHGEQGQGNVQFHAPALVNNESWYLYRQLMNFRNGIRGGDSSTDTLGFQMAAMAKTLTDSNAVADVVAYIISLPSTTPVIAIKGDVKKGERNYQSVCGSCHGQAGKGNKLMNAPRLNGLDDWYLKEQISKFKASIRGSHPKDVYGSQMIPMVASLRDEQAIDDVVAYILSVNQPDSIQ
jgi:cytochrome c oxidase subunit 2